ncbi:MAG: benzoyl-CoA reductase subunit D [Myxococcales bacterium]|nr:benzoyl-CoA reductase subunit D [Myxococcales bacterium]
MNPKPQASTGSASNGNPLGASRALAQLLTAGVDVGTGAVKAVVVGFDKSGAPQVVAAHRERIHRRELSTVAKLAFEGALAEAGCKRSDIAYVASTGEGESLDFLDGHFYGMTTHARGASFLVPEARAVMDCGALHARVMIVDEKSRVLRSRMTSQCAAGTGQFLENIARYLGIRADEVGPLSLSAKRAEQCSGICAVLSETDVINMVSRGVATGEILRGVHESIAQRLVRLLRALGAEGTVVLTGGLAADTGLKGAIERGLAADKGVPLRVVAPPLSAWAGAIGAALWGEVRRRRLEQQQAAAATG